MQKLTEIIAGGESNRVEFKSSLSEEREILETICGFSNMAGGTILVGVSDNGKIVGVDIGKKTVDDILNKIKFSIEPTIIPQAEVVEMDGKKVLVINVMEGINKPYFIGGVSFKRVGKTNQRLTKEELERIILEKYKGIVSFEERVISEGASEIDEQEVRRFVESVKSSRNIALTHSSIKEFFERLGLLREDRLTNAAVLCFSRKPELHLPYAILKCGRIRDGIISEREITGPLLSQVEKGLGFLIEHLSFSHTVGEDGKRVEHYEIPVEALREALVNAIVHRDYEIASPIYVKIFDDKIEVVNPGRLLPPLTPEKLKREHPSILRNPKIANIFFLYGFIERWGYGINKMIEACVKNGLKEPEFSEEDGFFKTLIYRRKINEMEMMVLELVKKGVNKSSLIAKRLRINERTARKYLASLLSKGLIFRKRVGRKVFYY